MDVLRTSLESPATADVREPITIADVKQHLNQTLDADDEYIVGLIAKARDYVEAELRRSLVARTATMTLARFPVWQIRLPYGKATSVTSIVYRNSAGTAVTLSGSASPAVFQQALEDEDCGYLTPLRTSVWPTADELSIDPVVITWEAGYATPELVPETIRHALALQVAEWYEARSALEAPANTGDLLQRAIGPYTLRIP